MAFPDHVHLYFTHIDIRSNSITLLHLCIIGRIVDRFCDMAFPDHAQLLFCSSYSGTLLCTIYRNYGISQPTLVFTHIDMCS